MINLIGRGKVKSLAKELGKAFRAFQEGLYGGKGEGEISESDEELRRRIRELENELIRLRRKLEETRRSE